MMLDIDMIGLNFKIEECGYCDWFVRCPRCGNNSCNGGYGEDGKCPICPLAYAVQAALVKSTTVTIRLFVDDERYPQDFDRVGWAVARTSAKAIAYLAKGNVVECSLDYDLGGEDTGYKVACWMEENNVWPKLGTHCHSGDLAGKRRIEEVIRKAYKEK